VRKLAINNLYEIIAYILKEIDRNGNPDNAEKEFDLSGEQYKAILDTMKLDDYIKCDKIFMDGTPNTDYALITSKGYNLISKFG
jgi:hypothetical protein